MGDVVTALIALEPLLGEDWEVSAGGIEEGILASRQSTQRGELVLPVDALKHPAFGLVAFGTT
jgi:hypothetical protein